jgi:capsular exopolysaccharide synthesis family protein
VNEEQNTSPAAFSHSSANGPSSNGSANGAHSNGQNIRAVEIAPNFGSAEGEGSGMMTHEGVRSHATYARTSTRRDDDAGESIDLQQLVAMLIRRRKVMAATFIAVLALIVGYTWFARPIYSASAKILVNTNKTAARPDDISVINDVLSNTGGRTSATQEELLKSRSIREGAMKRLPADARAQLAKYSRVSVTSVRDTDVLEVSAQSYNGAAAALLCNALSQEFIAQSLEQNKDETRAASTYVERERQRVSLQLDNARLALLKFKRGEGLFDLKAQAQAQVEQLGRLEADLRQAQADLQSSRAQAGKLRQLASGIPETETIPEQIQRPAIQEAVNAEAAKVEIELQNAQKEYTADSIEVRTLERQLASLRARGRQSTGREVRSWRTQVNPARLAIVQDLAKAQGESVALDARVKALNGIAETLRERSTALPDKEYQLSKLLTTVTTLEQLDALLTQKGQNLKIGEEARLPNARMVEQAVTPLAPISPRRGRNLVMGVIFGLLCAIALAALVDRLDDRVHTDAEAEAATGLPVLTHVPFIQNEEEQCLAGREIKTSPLLESYRMLRTNIAFSAVDEPIRSIVMSSSLPSEGKSSSSVNLATVMALSGKKVIIVDCDLRRPKIHRLMNLRNQVGFSSVVAGLSTLDDALQDTNVPNLRVLSSGPMPPNPPEMLDSRAGRAVLQQVADTADFVIYDCPPALVMTDAQIVATSADAVLLVVSCKEAGKREIARTSDSLMQSGTRVLGIILNKMPVGMGGYYGGYYGGYRYGEYMKVGPGSNESTLEEAAALAGQDSKAIKPK